MTEFTIVGAGLAGLVAAIQVAESVGERSGGAGVRVVLHEATGEVGGRARTDRGDRRVNLGPHAFYRHGAFETWLLARGLLPPVSWPRTFDVRIRAGGRLRRLPLPLLPMLRSLREPAPVDRDYRSWACERMGAAGAEAAIGFAALPTFHADPGTLSAAFVHERIARSLQRRSVYYVLGGWQRLVESLAGRARDLGVRIVTGSKLTTLPAGPCIVATDLPAAARLLGEPGLAWPRARTALYDVAFTPRRGDATAVLDLDQRVFASRYSRRDPSLVASGESLVQACTGLREGETTAQAHARIEEVLAAGFPGWSQRIRWRRKGVSEGASPADPPGTSWRDRPAIDRGDDRWLAGDCVAAPGVLSEVSFESAREAATRAVEKCLGTPIRPQRSS